MTARMIRFDDEYTQKLEAFIASTNGHVELVSDENLLEDPYYYERKKSLTNTMDALSSGTMKKVDFNHSIDILISKYS